MQVDVDGFLENNIHMFPNAKTDATSEVVTVKQIKFLWVPTFNTIFCL